MRTFAYADGRRKFVEAILDSRLFRRGGRTALLALLLASPPALAGPPYLTDDPEPVDYLHWEYFTYSTGTRALGGASGDTPAIEYDYGIIPNGRVAIIAPMAFDRSTGEPFKWGYGDTQLELKYRFVQQDKNGWTPSIGVVPSVELPSGDVHRDLGNGVTRVFLPIWLQKDFGDWTTYGGGGYWINPGFGNKNFWFVGWVLQRKITDKLAIGAELFHQTAEKVDKKDGTGFNVAAIYDVTENHHLLFSIGRGIRHAREMNELSWYLGLLVTNGDAKSARKTDAGSLPATLNWTGFYVGADFGNARQRASEADTIGGESDENNDVGPFFSSYSLRGLIGGPFTGFNWQAGPLVLGIEADVEAAAVRGGERPILVGMTQRHDLRASARGRIGVAVGRTLPYVTGGAAIANFFPSALGESFDRSNPGWTIGGGIEYAFTETWSGRIEFRHSDFGSATYESENFDGNRYRIRIKDDALRAGVAYRFALGEPKPVSGDADTFR